MSSADQFFSSPWPSYATDFASALPLPLPLPVPLPLAKLIARPARLNLTGPISGLAREPLCLACVFRGRPRAWARARGLERPKRTLTLC